VRLEEEEEDIPAGEREMTQWRMGADQRPLEGGMRCGEEGEEDDDEEDAHQVGEDGPQDSPTEFLTAARVRPGGSACVLFDTHASRIYIYIYIYNIWIYGYIYLCVYILCIYIYP
jgi:hypothetical protein